MVAGAAVASLLLAGGHGVVQKLLGDTSFAGVVVDGEVVGRIAGSFSHPNQFAGYLICFIPLAGALAATRSSSPRLRALCIAALCLSLPALAFSLTRGAILGLVLGSVVWVMLIRPKLALPLVTVIAVIGISLAPGALQARLTDSTGGDLGLRSDLWQSALDIYSTRPIDGVGLGNFGEAYGRLPAQLSTGTQRRLLHQSQLLVPPHANNLPLTILAEEGLIGVIAFLGFMGAALWTCREVALLEDPFARALGLGLGAGLCAMLVQSLLDFALFGEPSLPLYALMGCAAVLTASRPASGALERHARAG
jgi:O-antigen ligase